MRVYFKVHYNKPVAQISKDTNYTTLNRQHYTAYTHDTYIYEKSMQNQILSLKVGSSNPLSSRNWGMVAPDYRVCMPLPWNTWSHCLHMCHMPVEQTDQVNSASRTDAAVQVPRNLQQASA